MSLTYSMIALLLKERLNLTSEEKWGNLKKIENNRNHNLLPLF
jgi:hypothetical protein